MCGIEKLLRAWFKANIWSTHSDLRRRAGRNVYVLAWKNEWGLLMNPFFKSHFNCCLSIMIFNSCENSRNVNSLHEWCCLQIICNDKKFSFNISKRMVVSILVKRRLCLMALSDGLKYYISEGLQVCNKSYKQEI